VAHLATAGALAAAGLGVAALPSLTLPVLGRSSLVVRELESPRMVRRIGIVQATGRTPLPAAREFRRLLEATDLPGLLAEAEES
jgi:DNA-binding transcriptional LysR family regulator